ncbi:uncharacterized protein LY89DRAFT_785441 [Mollisia scopiformis]|uniref:Uncharacterized protein n=1 Tax=Mollisia scopiformis TaxID=149040 RepID=A0A194WYV9_MOLSC|nr:uncharacterized protein LY89DRAFT_785441 [Mollisia scopiformis]KUJ12879.1 hypothetical protein LY89DRAFT_785441 [Mollisia scopiformis]
MLSALYSKLHLHKQSHRLIGRCFVLSQGLAQERNGGVRVCAVIYRSTSTCPDRPIFSFQVYDTTENSADHAHLDAVATKIHEDTYEERDFYGGMFSDRLDFYGLAMPSDTTQEERVQKCIEHQKAEIAARNATGKTDYYIPGTFDQRDYQRQFVIIDKTDPQWEQGEGGFLKVRYDLLHGEREEDDQCPEISCRRADGINALGKWLYESKSIGQWFYETYVGGGLIQEEMPRARRSRK